MAKIYVHPLRRGWKVTDINGNITQDDWVEYEKDPEHLKPIEGELVLEYDNGIPRLKIGDGIHKFSELPYMSIDSFILPKQAFVELSTNWTEETKNEKVRYYQEVIVNNATITLNSKVDLQPTAEQLYTFHQKDLAFVAENDGGKIRVYCVGLVPQNGYTIPATVTEVVADEESIIVGNTTATPNPQPDWDQTDDNKADYIKNKPNMADYMRTAALEQYVEQEMKDYIKNTDYAFDGLPGIITVATIKGADVTEDGLLKAYSFGEDGYNNLISDDAFISKGTLENIKYSYVKDGLVNSTETWSDDETDADGQRVKGDKTKARELIGAVGFNDYAQEGTAGVICLHPYYGVKLDTQNNLACESLSNITYKNKGTNLFISKGTLEAIKSDYVKSSLIDTAPSWSTSEKESICEGLGAATQDYVDNLPDKLTLTHDDVDNLGNINEGTQTKWRNWLGVTSGTKLYAHKVTAYFDMYEFQSSTGSVEFLIVSTIKDSFLHRNVERISTDYLSIRPMQASVYVITPDGEEYMDYIHILSVSDDGSIMVCYSDVQMRIFNCDLYSIHDDEVTEL